MVTFYQIATRIPTLYSVEFPPAVQRLLNSFSSIVSFGIDAIGPSLECMGDTGYLSQLRTFMVLPACLVAAIVALAWLWVLKGRRRTAASLLEFALPPTLKLLFVAYPVVTNKVQSCSTSPALFLTLDHTYSRPCTSKPYPCGPDHLAGLPGIRVPQVLAASDR